MSVPLGNVDFVLLPVHLDDAISHIRPCRSHALEQVLERTAYPAEGHGEEVLGVKLPQGLLPRLFFHLLLQSSQLWYVFAREREAGLERDIVETCDDDLGLKQGKHSLDLHFELRQVGGNPRSCGCLAGCLTCRRLDGWQHSDTADDVGCLRNEIEAHGAEQGVGSCKGISNPHRDAFRLLDSRRAC